MVNKIKTFFKFKKNTIARKLILFIILFSSAITLLGTSFQLYLEYQRDLSSVKKSIRQIERSYLDTIIETLWVSNYRFLEIQLEGILRMSDIEHLEIRHNGQQIIAAGKTDSTKVISASYPLNREYRGQKMTLGTLIVTASTAGVYGRLLDRVIVTMGTQAVKTFLVVLFMFSVFYYLVGRHLLTLTDYSQNLSSDNLNEPLQLKGRSNQKEQWDEFDHLIFAFNAMRNNLMQSFADLHQSNLRLQDEISDRKATEQALSASEKRFKELSQEFQAVLDGIPDSLLLRDRDYRIIWTNKGAAQLFNRGNADLSGTFCFALWCRSDEPCEDCPGDVCFRDGSVQSGYCETADGRLWEKSFFPIENPRGEVEKIIEWSRDITEQHRLAEETLRAGRLAAVGELATGVAHEINNPNSLVLINAPLLKRAWNEIRPIVESYYREHENLPLAGLSYDEFVREAPFLFDEMYEGAQRIKRIVDDLKDFVRRDRSGDHEPIDVNEVVRTAVRLSSNSIKKATNHFSLSCADVLPQSPGNFQQIEQVIVNLLLNACQALTDRERKVSVTTCFDQKNRHNCIRIADEGCGIKRENLDKITDPFFTTKREQGGTGLGLSVSSRIVIEHNGVLNFISAPGKGTIVEFELPTIDEEGLE